MKKLFALVLILMMAFAAAAEGSFVPALDTDTSCAISVVGHYSNFEALENAFNRSPAAAMAASSWSIPINLP